jgi:hypothetical protein
MQFHSEPRDGNDYELEVSVEHPHVDYAALRILATWVARRRGVDPELGAAIDRAFVVAQAHA